MILGRGPKASPDCLGCPRARKGEGPLSSCLSDVAPTLPFGPISGHPCPPAPMTLYFIRTELQTVAPDVLFLPASLCRCCSFCFEHSCPLPTPAGPSSLCFAGTFCRTPSLIPPAAVGVSARSGGWFPALFSPGPPAPGRQGLRAAACRLPRA